jgi:hypothetical protein
MKRAWKLEGKRVQQTNGHGESCLGLPVALHTASGFVGARLTANQRQRLKARLLSNASRLPLRLVLTSLPTPPAVSNNATHMH